MNLLILLQILLLHISLYFCQIKQDSSCHPLPFPMFVNSPCCGIDVTEKGSSYTYGKATGLRQYPWLTLIEYWSPDKQNLELLCGGSLISTRHVLTAAHCVTAPMTVDKKVSAVRIGEYNKTNPGMDCMHGDCTVPYRAFISQIMYHPNYNGHYQHDIALIMLMIDVPYTEHIRPICLPSHDFTQFVQAGYNLTVAGFGAMAQLPSADGHMEYIDSDVKRHAFLQYIPIDFCQQLLSRRALTRSNICAGIVEGSNACFGDSGGPLMMEFNGHYVLVGVVSYGGIPDICAAQGFPTIFTDVWRHMEWIRSMVYLQPVYYRGSFSKK